MNSNAVFDSFIQAGKFLREWSPKTERSYRQAFASFQQSQSNSTEREVPQGIAKGQLELWVVSMRQRGMTPGGCNAYIRGMNSFLGWLHDEGRITERLRLKVLRNPPMPVETFTSEEISRLLALKPSSTSGRRAWLLVLCLMDTGIRIAEALSLEQSNVDLDNLSLRVRGKGNKLRDVPFSHTMRKFLFRQITRMPGRFVFQTRDGESLMYRNAARDIERVCESAGVCGERVHPHAFRHFFAVNYIRQGGDIYRLSRILGHTSIATTQLYLRSMTVEQVGQAHRSPLAGRANHPMSESPATLTPVSRSSGSRRGNLCQ